jgi:hypothetical protein
MTAVSRRADARKEGDVRPLPEPSKRPSLLAALGLPGVTSWSIETLPDLSVGELLALIFYNPGGEDDLVLSLLRHMDADLGVLHDALCADMPRSDDDLLTVVSRLNTTAMVAVELQRRTIAAARAA